MATSLISSVNVPSISSTADISQMGSSVFPLKTSFLCGDTKKLFSAHLRSTRRLVTARKFQSPSASDLFDHIPKRFREENLTDGLMDNYKSAPQYLYGLSPSQLAMFMTEDNPAKRQTEKLTEESISSNRSYRDLGVWSLSGMKDGSPSLYSGGSSVSMYGGSNVSMSGGRRPRSAPPDLPSILMDQRIVYLGMPIVPQVTELLCAEFMYLDYDDQTKPIYLYVNSTGTQDEEGRLVGSETDAYAIADSMLRCKSKLYTVNVGAAYGQAAMLLSLGQKGFRALQPNASTTLYLPEFDRSSGQSTDMWIKANDLDANTDYYLRLLARGIGKSEQEIKKDIRRGGRAFDAEQAIEYGIADRVIEKDKETYVKRDYEGEASSIKSKS